MSYFRHSYTTFEEFNREALPIEDLGKDELDLLEELEADDEFDRRPRRHRSDWD